MQECSTVIYTILYPLIEDGILRSDVIPGKSSPCHAIVLYRNGGVVSECHECTILSRSRKIGHLMRQYKISLTAGIHQCDTPGLAPQMLQQRIGRIICLVATQILPEVGIGHKRHIAVHDGGIKRAAAQRGNRHNNKRQKTTKRKRKVQFHGA